MTDLQQAKAPEVAGKRALMDWRSPVRIATVIPCYNEAGRIGTVLEALPDTVGVVIVVDDGSTDGTADAVERLGDPRVVLLRHPRNQGVGAAMRTGYREAIARGAEIVVKMDGDGQMAAADLPALLAPVLAGRADYVKGNRFHDIEALEGMPWVRRIGNGVLSFMVKLVSGYWSVLDPTNGYTAMNAAMLRRLDLDRLAPHYFFETSVLIELNIKGAVVRDVPLPARYGDEGSSLRIPRVLIQFPPLLARGLARRLLWRYLIYDFNVITVSVLAGVPLLLFGVGFGAYHWIQSIRTGIPASAGTTLLAALPVILGVQFLMVAVVLDVIFEPGRGRGGE